MEKKSSPGKAAPRATVKKETPKARAAVAPAAKARAAKAAPKKAAALGLTKQFLKSRPVCKVTFRLPAEAAGGSSSASVVGDFNGWQAGALPMKRLRDGSFTATVELEAGREYCFRYLLDGGRWENDWCADRYELGPYGDENSVVVC